MPLALLGKVLSIVEGGKGFLAAGPCSWLPAGRNMLVEVSQELGFSLEGRRSWRAEGKQAGRCSQGSWESLAVFAIPGGSGKQVPQGKESGSWGLGLWEGRRHF